MVKKAGIDSGIGHISPHTLRRTCARLLRLKGVAVDVIQKKLGHSGIETTMTYIGDIVDIAQQECSNTLNGNKKNTWLSDELEVI